MIYYQQKDYSQIIVYCKRLLLAKIDTAIDYCSLLHERISDYPSSHTYRW